MDKKRRIYLASLVAAVLVVLFWVMLFPSRPSFQGQPLNAWLDKLGYFNAENSFYSWNDVDLSPISGNAKAADAIRHIASNSFPYLLHAITNKESVLKKRITGFLPSWLKNLIPAENIAGPRGEAVLAFFALGTQAESTATKLANALHDDESSKAAGLALSAIGPKGWAALTQAIVSGTNIYDNAAISAIWALARLRVAVPGTVEALESAVTNTANSSVAGIACWALGRIGQDKEHVVPFLITVMESPANKGIEWCAIQGLGEFGTNAASAVPLLLQARQSTNHTLGFTATFALRKIDPKAAAQAGDRFPGYVKYLNGMEPKADAPGRADWLNPPTGPPTNGLVPKAPPAASVK